MGDSTVISHWEMVLRAHSVERIGHCLRGVLDTGYPGRSAGNDVRFTPGQSKQT